MKDFALDLHRNWLVLAPGTHMIFRRPVPQQFARPFLDAGCELATCAQLGLANLGFLFPWGDNPDSTKTGNPLWAKHRIGYSGLYHTEWFRAREGRFFGAPNVATQGKPSLRACILFDGGSTCDIRDNEGFAFVRQTDEVTQQMYYDVQVYAAERVGADGGRLLVSPVDQLKRVWMGFTGRCLECPNLEKISAPALREEFPNYFFELWQEWQNWRIPHKAAAIAHPVSVSV